MSGNPFTSHPHDVGESYGQHCTHAGRVGFQLIGAGIACVIHAVLPFVFVNTASDLIRKLNRGIEKRVDAPNWERHPII
ncbi:DUF6356 family protein [Allosphingosinicella indica]|uniref:Capsule biosynthesis protein n=1 Tax=Allosphingosinicella indica TaxID=941907 RepID=A0A1X7GH55_9SPHN|nr:DUF6356 family protein [Allosphingosinicella indica]SMF69666.1 hypothetical protein SAMN06295910_1758 [Allosphingosinicella indica]